jgi:lysozyme
MIKPMQYSKTGISLTERFEGVRLSAYYDHFGEVWTIGYGHTRGVVPGMTCTEEQAEEWLMQDTQAAQAVVNNVITVQLDQEEFDALVDFEFNTGCLRGSHMATLINNKQFIAAAVLFTDYDHAGGMEVAGLLRRRVADEREFLKGVECDIS